MDNFMDSISHSYASSGDTAPIYEFNPGSNIFSLGRDSDPAVPGINCLCERAVNRILLSGRVRFIIRDEVNQLKSDSLYKDGTSAISTSQSVYLTL